MIGGVWVGCIEDGVLLVGFGTPGGGEGGGVMLCHHSSCAKSGVLDGVTKHGLECSQASKTQNE
jgi:hypothetical protein